MYGRTDGQTDGRTDGRANTAYCEYVDGTDAFMSLHKPIVTLFLTRINPLYELTNSIAGSSGHGLTDKVATICFPIWGAYNVCCHKVSTGSILKHWNCR